MISVDRRQYNQDLRIETRRPSPPQGLVFDSMKMELTWAGPSSGPEYSHFNIRLDSDTSSVSFRVPAGTTRLTVIRPATVTISCWNDIVQTESDSARISVNSIGVWTGSTVAYGTVGPDLFVRYDLTANLTVVSPISARVNQTLALVVFQHATTEYTLSFDPADFIDTATQHIDSAMAWICHFVGMPDGRWCRLGLPITFDPTI